MTDSRTDSGGSLAAYEDDGSLVICSRRNPNAWIRSDTTMDLADLDSERRSVVP